MSSMREEEQWPHDLIAFKWANTLSQGEQDVLLAHNLKLLQQRINSALQHREQEVRKETITDEQITRVIMAPENAAWFSQYLAEYSAATGRFEKRLEEARVGGWQPIESAPKDSSWILA